jgi:hypothetical protein
MFSLRLAFAILSFATSTSADLWCPGSYHAICTNTSQPGILAPFFWILGDVAPASEYVACIYKLERSVFTSNSCWEIVIVRYAPFVDDWEGRNANELL